jgi:hypothetical protein
LSRRIPTESIANPRYRASAGSPPPDIANGAAAFAKRSRIAGKPEIAVANPLVIACLLASTLDNSDEPMRCPVDSARLNFTFLTGILLRLNVLAEVDEEAMKISQVFSGRT